jgi:hypothetical protein
VNDDELIGKDGEKVGNSAVRLNTAIVNLVHAHGLPFLLSETAFFCCIIRLAKFAPPKYEHPKRKLVGSRILTANHKEYMHHIMYDQLDLQADTFGVCLLWDCPW